MIQNVRLKLSDRQELEKRVGRQNGTNVEAQRARLILLFSEGKSKSEISRQLNLHRNQVIKWIARFKQSGLEGLKNMSRPGRPKLYSQRQEKAVIEKVCQQPPKGLSKWSVRSLAEKSKINRDKVHRILKENSLYPHRLNTFMYSPDPQFEDKLLDIVGLYMNPPLNAIVLCVDEKTGIQALDRTQPMLPLRSRKPKAWSNEYVRHGTRTLLAALDIKTGTVTAWVNKTRKTVDFITFMDKVVKAYPDKRLCIVLDNLNTHKGNAAKEWLAQHPLVSFHYTPTHASWVNLVECFFSILTRKGLQQSIHRSVKDLERFLDHFIKQYNKNCGPFTWTKGPKKLKKIIQLTKEFKNQPVQLII
jgi:transposase